MTVPKELRLLGVTHIVDLDNAVALCGQMIYGPTNGHFQSGKSEFIRKLFTSFIHCHRCEETLTVWDHINATEV